MQPARTPHPPYYAVIFTSLRTEGDDGYAATATRMIELAAQQPGFLGVESARSSGSDNSEGLGITVSYWESEEAITAWRRETEHRLAREKGRTQWYERFVVRVCRVERAYEFETGSENIQLRGPSAPI